MKHCPPGRRQLEWNKFFRSPKFYCEDLPSRLIEREGILLNSREEGTLKFSFVFLRDLCGEEFVLHNVRGDGKL